MSAIPRVPSFVLAAVVAVGLGVLATSALEDNLVYYRTPSEVLAEPPPPEERVRLGGLVVEGSVSRFAEVDSAVLLRITDGAHDVDVVHRGPLPEIFEEGQGAIVEGFLVDGSFESDKLVVRHSNEYRPAEPNDVAAPEQVAAPNPP